MMQGQDSHANRYYVVFEDGVGAVSLDAESGLPLGSIQSDEDARRYAEQYMAGGDWNADEHGTQHIGYEIYTVPNMSLN